MNTEVIIQILILCGFLVNGVVALVNYFATRQVHTMVNSRMTELLELTRKSSEAMGRVAGAAEQKGKDR